MLHMVVVGGWVGGWLFTRMVHRQAMHGGLIAWERQCSRRQQLGVTKALSISNSRNWQMLEAVVTPNYCGEGAMLKSL